MTSERSPRSLACPFGFSMLLALASAAACDASDPASGDAGAKDDGGAKEHDGSVAPDSSRDAAWLEGSAADSSDSAGQSDAATNGDAAGDTTTTPDSAKPPPEAGLDGTFDGRSEDGGSGDGGPRDGGSVDGAIADVATGADGAKPDAGPPTTANAPVAIYWGQNGYGGAHPGDKTKYEKSLGDLCNDDHVGLVLLSFMTSFISARNGDLPELNFAFHCETAYDAAHPFLLRCPEIEAAIMSCQARGIRVVISLGGAAGAYGFTSDAQAETFAQTMWDMFLGGQGAIRPFGAAVLDGVDLDIEGGATTGYSAFVKKTRALMDAGAGKRFLITAAPQCVYPDAYLGPATGKPLGDAADAFDYLLVQFYNNFCSFANRSEFDAAFAQWAAVAKNGRPRLLVGLPASTEAAGGFVPRADVPALVTFAAGKSNFAGISLWDTSYDQNNVEGGQTYSALVDGILRNAGIKL